MMPTYRKYHSLDSDVQSDYTRTFCSIMCSRAEVLTEQAISRGGGHIAYIIRDGISDDYIATRFSRAWMSHVSHYD